MLFLLAPDGSKPSNPSSSSHTFHLETLVLLAGCVSSGFLRRT
jgi:hypothetical protein